MPIGSGGLQNFLRMTGLFGPQDDSAAYEGMPSELPMARGTPPLVNRQPNAGVSMPGAYGPEAQQGFNPQAIGEEEDTLAAFKQNVMNPPKRTRMTYPKNTLAGLDAALKIAAEPSPLEKNRVWVNGKAHQKQQVRIDPVTGEKQFITNVHEPSFMSQVMRAMPAAVSPAVDILNQPREDAMEDWDLKNKGLAASAKAESEMALAKQRNANAGAIPGRLDQGQQKIDISRMTAEEKARVSQLNTLTDTEKIELLQSGKITLAELNASNAMARTNVQQEGANARTAATVAGAGERNAATNIAAGERNAATNTAAGERTAATIAGAGERTAAGIAGRAASGGAASQVPTQQRIAAQAKATQLINDHPEWSDKITMDPDTQMPVIKPPNDPYFGEPDYTEYDKIYEALYGRKRGSATPTPTPAKPAARPAAAVGTKPAPVVAPVKEPGTPIKQYSASRDQTRISTDGGKTWKVVKGRQ
jgi:hypothetical protein